MPEIHLKQPAFTSSTCSPFTTNKETIKKFMQTWNSDFIYKNDLDKACFQHGMAYGKSRDLAKGTEPDKVLRDRAFKIASDPKWLASVVYKLFDKKNSGGGITAEPNYQLDLEMNFIGRLLENWKEENFIHLLETIFGVLI